MQHFHPTKGQRGEPANDRAQYHCVQSLPEFAKRANLSVATLRRLVAAGDGPPVTRLSERRIGIRNDHGQQWLDARAR